MNGASASPGSASIIAPVTIGDARAIAKVHASAFLNEAWGKASIEETLNMAGVSGLMATGPLGPRAFILVRQVLDEAEILTVAVHAKARRQGLATRLLNATVSALREGGAATLHLEVAADNASALALYENFAFQVSGRRAGYYRRGAVQVDALLMLLPIKG